jgi:hypothetical protein
MDAYPQEGLRVSDRDPTHVKFTSMQCESRPEVGAEIGSGTHD